MSTLEDTILSSLNMNAQHVSLDGAEKWGGPSVQGQINREHSWSFADVSVDVFDLSNKSHIKLYQGILKQSMEQDPTVVILEQDRVFCDSTANWKVFVTSVEITYKKLTGTER